jgi:hypothetical protein
MRAKDPDRERVEDSLGRLLGAAFDLDDIALGRVRSVWDGLDEAQRLYTWRQVERALKTTGRRRLMDDARDAVRQWVSSASAQSSAFGLPVQPMGPPLDARVRASGAILAAAAAVIVGDQLEPTERALLMRPFASRPRVRKRDDRSQLEIDRDRYWDLPAAGCDSCAGRSPAQPEE